MNDYSNKIKLTNRIKQKTLKPYKNVKATTQLLS